MGENDIFINYFGRIKIFTIFAPPNAILVFGESVAQQVEHNTFNVGVPGSSPGGFTSFFMLSGRVFTLLLCFL